MQQMAYAELEVALSDSRALAATPFVSQRPGVSGHGRFRVLVLRTVGVALERRWGVIGAAVLSTVRMLLVCR